MAEAILPRTVRIQERHPKLEKGFTETELFVDESRDLTKTSRIYYLKSE